MSAPVEERPTVVEEHPEPAAQVDPVLATAAALMRRATEAQRLARIAAAAEDAFQESLPEELRATSSPWSWAAAAKAVERKRTH